MTATETISIKNAGAIERLDISFGTEGGISVLKGRNGSGKSTALNAVGSLIGDRRLDATLHDGAVKGEVAGYGAKITIGRVNRKTGTAEVLSIEDRLDISSLVDPGIADPEKADAKRIKSLVSLSGGNADPAIFFALAKDRAEFGAIVQDESIATKDVLEMAARIKRDFESAARKQESDANISTGAATSCRESAKGLDLEAEQDPAVLQSALLAANTAHTRLTEQRKARIEADAKLTDTKAKLAEAKAKSTVSLEGMKRDLASQQRELTNAESIRDRLKAELEEAERRVTAIQEEVDDLGDEIRTAETNELNIANWEAAIAAVESMPNPSEEEIEAAAQAIVTAQTANDNGVKIREAKKSLAAAEEHDEKAKLATETATRYRKSAANVDNILSGIVKSETLRVKDSRLVTTTTRGDVCYSDLSDGERWKIAIDLAADRVGAGGVFTIPQAAYEALDPDNRAAIAERARERKVRIITAEAAAGDLRVEEFEPEAALA